jgi:hypothetical protein
MELQMMFLFAGDCQLDDDYHGIHPEETVGGDDPFLTE